MQLKISNRKRRSIKRKKKYLDKNYIYINLIILASVIIAIWFAFDYFLVKDSFDPLNPNDMTDSLFMGVRIFVALLVGLVFGGIRSVIVGTHVTEEFGVTMDIDDKMLVHSVLMPRGEGYFSAIQGNVRKYDVVTLTEIEDCKFDPKTKRIEIITSGKEIFWLN